MCGANNSILIHNLNVNFLIESRVLYASIQNKYSSHKSSVSGQTFGRVHKHNIYSKSFANIKKRYQPAIGIPLACTRPGI